MKLTVFLSLFFIQATTAAQTVTLKVKDASLFDVLAAIRKQTGIYFTFSETTVASAKPVSLDVKSATLTQALDEAMQMQDLEYKFIDLKTILITPRRKERKSPDSILQDDSSYTDLIGTVTTERGESLPSASIRVKRNGQVITGIITGAKGDFVLKNLIPGDELYISYTGYDPQTIKYTGQNEVKAVLSEASKNLDKVVVEGYSQTTQRLSTGNRVTITSKDIERQPVFNVLQALQGKVANLVITQTNGYASGPVKSEIRGRSVIDPSLPSDPLYIVDGVQVGGLNIGNRGGYESGSSGVLQNGMVGPAGGQSPLWMINPKEIESVTVLKDGDATSIYGSRGGNGVIIIKTKSGRPGRTKLDLSASTGISFQPMRYKVMSKSEYLLMREEAFVNDNVDMNPGNAFDVLLWKNNKTTNWQDFFWNGTANNQILQASLSGGTTSTTYRISGSFDKRSSLNNFKGSDERASLQFNLQNRGLNEKFNVSLTGMYTYAKSNLIDLQGSILTPPNAPDIFDSAGSLNFTGWEPSTLFRYEYLLQPYVATTGFLNSQLRFEYNILKGLSISTNLGYSTESVDQNNKYPIESMNPIYAPKGRLSVGYNKGTRVIIEPQMEYKTYLFKGELNVIVGGAYQKMSQLGNAMYGSGYIDDNLLSSISNAEVVTASDNFGEYKYASLLTRLKYNLNDKYLLNFSGRRDGSSKFGPKRQFGNFGSVGVAWIVSEEPFFLPLRKVFNYAKLRLSYGQTGSDIIGDYKYLTRWTSSGTPSYMGGTTYVPTQHANPYLQWQVDKKFEAGINLSVLGERHELSFSYYQNRIGNQLVTFSLPVSTGFGDVTANMPAVIQNRGIEITTQSHLFKGLFKWDLDFNIGFNRNILLKFPGIEETPYFYSFQVGKSLSIKRLLQYERVDRETGEYVFYDSNKDGAIISSPGKEDDLIVNKDMSVQFNGGMGSNFSYKNFTLFTQFDFRKQLGRSSLFSNPYFGLPVNQSPEVLRRWQKPGDETDIAKFSVRYRVDQTNITQSDRMYVDASFIRLNNVSLSYDFDSKIVKPIGISGCRVYVRAQNIFVITPYKGIDPETQAFGQLPPFKTCVLGIDVKF